MNYKTIALFVLVLLGAACGGGPSQPASQAPAAASDSPLDEFFGGAGGSDAAFLAFQLDFQEAVATCMRGEGFEYVPFVATESSSRDADLSDEDYAATFGYGISTTSSEFLGGFAENPNNRHIFSLPEAEAEAYVLGLYGKVIGAAVINEVALDPAVQVPTEEQGCSGVALEANGGSQLWDDFAKLGLKFAAYDDALMREPSIVAANDAWVDCVVAEGYEYESSEDVRLYISEQFETLINPHLAEFAQLDSGQLERLLERRDNSVIPDFDVDGLTSLQQLEVDLASADYRCYDAHLEEILLPRQQEIEQQIIDEETDVLSGIRDLTSAG